MNARDAIRGSMDLTDYVLKSYVNDLSDAELLTRSVTGINHLAWQLGHLISSEQQLLNSVCPGSAPELPAGFGEQHNKEATAVDDPAKFLKKDRYVELYDRQRKATREALAKLSDADLDRPGPEQFKKICPTVGAVFNLIASHPMMHAGQFVAARRALGKPIVI